MQNSTVKFRQISFVSKKPSYLPQNWDYLSTTSIESTIFTGILHIFPTWQHLNEGVPDFDFDFYLELLKKSKNLGFCECVETKYFF